MKKTKAEKGITLIALIITIIVLIILAVVTIQAVQEHGIIGYAKQAQKASIEAEEKDQIGLALSEWRIAKAQPNPPSFEDFLKEKFGEGNVTAGTEEGEWLITFPKSGNQYKVKEDGTIENSKGISLSKSSLTLTLKEGETVTDTITATLHGVEGSADEIAWTIQDATKATINPEKGATVTVTAVAAGETTITATYGEYTATCQVTVEEEQNEQEIAVGDFVEYNVEYTDVYNDAYKYTAQNGWRYLGKDDNGNNLIISTGIPARMIVVVPNLGKPDYSFDVSWCVTDESMLTEFRAFFEDGYYQVDSRDERNYPLELAAGLYYNFDKIKFIPEDFPGDGIGWFTSISNDGVTYDRSGATEVQGSALFISKDVPGATVRTLTVPEMLKTIGIEEVVSQIKEDQDLLGIYRLDQLQNVKGMSDFVYPSNYGDYMLATPEVTSDQAINGIYELESDGRLGFTTSPLGRSSTCDCSSI